MMLRPVRVRVPQEEGPPRDVVVEREVLAFGAYVRALYAYLRAYGWPRRHPLAIFARSFRKELEPGRSRYTFRGYSAASDALLGAHELGHERDLPHTVEPNTARGVVRAVFDQTTHTTMHPWGVFRKTDPEGLVREWERAVDEAEQLILPKAVG